jgi:hypothetical protein
VIGRVERHGEPRRARARSAYCAEAALDVLSDNALWISDTADALRRPT